MLSWPFLAAVQAAAVTLSVDPSKLILGSVLGIAGLLLAGLKFLGTRTLTAIEGVATQVATTEKAVTKISQELFGPDGKNGMRSDVKRLSQQINSHHSVIIELAVRNDIDVPERIP